MGWNVVIHALEVEFGDGLKRFDDAVQINRHLSELFIGEPDARIPWQCHARRVL